MSPAFAKGRGQKGAKQGKAERDGILNQQYHSFNEFKHGEFDALKMLRINLSRP